MGFRVNSAGKVNQGHFSKVPANVAAPRSAFDRSFSHKTTFNEGSLIPVFWEPILPGDTINLTGHFLGRLATPIFPYMDNVYLDYHMFFVPNRLLWEHWEQFQGAQNNPDDTTDYEVPSLDDATHAAGFGEGTVYDYFGLPTKVTNIPQENMPIALPLRGYYKIFNDWYRDENTQDSADFPITDGPDTTAYVLQQRNRRKDYFTSALPWPQKGPDVTISLGSTAPVLSNNAAFKMTGISNPTHTFEKTFTINGAGTDIAFTTAQANNGELAIWGSESGLYTDLAAASPITINELRESIVLQQMLELDARGGTRYVEILLARFGVISPDFRLQRSEYLGGQTFDINVNPIAQTSESGSSPQGNLAGFAMARGKAVINHSFVEHGQLLGICSFRADTTYQQGMNRHWSVRTRYDYYEPLAANLGEQALLNKEIYMVGGNTTDDLVFGYQERWAEYRYKPSYVTGKMRSNATGTLDSWHLAIKFTSLPTLEEVIPEAPPIARIVAVPSEPHFILDMFFKFKHTRVMPVYSAPGLTRL